MAETLTMTGIAHDVPPERVWMGLSDGRRVELTRQDLAKLARIHERQKRMKRPRKKPAPFWMQSQSIHPNPSHHPINGV